MAIRFGTDGWRAVIAEDFTFGAVREVARAAASATRRASQRERPSLVVGYDRRFGSDAFARAAAERIAQCGIDAHLCSTAIPTPAVSYAVTELPADGALMITASHNPPLFNGVKIKSERGSSASRSTLRAIELELESAQPDTGIASGQIREFDPTENYLARLMRLVNVERLRTLGYTVAVDAMFGVSAGLLPKLLGGDATQVVEINTAHNPLFPGISGPEPVERNLHRLKKIVADGGANLGIAFDGDGDRIGVVDERGEYVSAQHVFALLARYLLSIRGVKGPIVKSVTGSEMIDVIGQQASVPVIETATGFPHISEAMIDEGAALGGEESGGFAFGFHLPERDGLLSALLLLDYLAQTGRSLSALLGELESSVGVWRYRRIDLPVNTDLRAAIAGRLQDANWPVSMAGLNVSRVVPLDGTRIEFEDGSWLLVRQSGTEPMLRLYAEAHDQTTVDALLLASRELLGI